MRAPIHNSIENKKNGHPTSIILTRALVLLFVCVGFFVHTPSAEAAIQFVGSTTASGTNASYNATTTSLTGGIGTAPVQNDLIIVVNSFMGTADGNPGVGNVGYTEVGDFWANDTNDANVSVSYKFATATTETLIRCNGSPTAGNASVCTVMVFRGVSMVNPMDVASTSITGTNAANVNCPSITPVTSGSYVLCVGGAAGYSATGTIATISGYTHAYKQFDSTNSAAAVMAYKAWTTGAEDPAAFVIDLGTASANSWAALTMALRPAPVVISGTLFSDEGVTAITSPKTISIAVGSSSSPTLYSTTNDSSGNWSFSFATSSLATSTRLALWVDATSSIRAALFTKSSTTVGSITSLPLYQNRVIVSHEATTSTSTTIADLAFYDYTNDTDILYDASSTLGSLTILNGQELHVWTGKTIELMGSSTLTGNVHIATSSQLVGGATTTVLGDFNNTGGFTANGARYWSQVQLGGNFSSITYGNGLFVAVAYSGQVQTSPDGINWTSRTVPANAWQAVTYGNGTFVAVADSGTYRVITSSDGIIWDTATASAAYSWDGITYGLGSGTTTPLFVAVACGQSSCPDGLTSNLVMTSPDGINWTTRAAASSNPWTSVTYGNGKFVAVSWNGTNRAMTSTDGVTWSPQSEPVSNNWQNVTYGLGLGTTTPLFVGVGGNGSTGGAIITSPDGISWTNRTLPRDIGVFGVTYGNGLIVAVGYSRYALVSTDGVNWKDYDMGYSDLYYGVGFGKGMFSAVGDNGNVSTSKTLLTMSSTSAQTLSGTLTATSSLGNIAFTGAGTKTFANNASTTNLTINTGATVVAPAQLTINGNYTNSGTFTAGTGTTTFNGDGPQTATGTMTGTSAFANLLITNTSGSGSSTLQSVRFGASASTTDTLTMLASTSANFKANATSTFQNISLQGSAGSPVYIRSSISGTRAAFYVPGTQKQVTYVDVKDSSACPTTITVTNGTDSGNNLCWTFTVGGGGGGPITISGTLYSDEGITPYTASTTINIAISTSTTTYVSATSTNASGNWSFTLATSSLATSSRMVIWVNASTTLRASLFTKSASTSASITTLPLYKNRVIVSHEATTSTSTTIADLAFYDNDNDSDIQYNATTTSAGLVVNAGNELYVRTGKVFSPGGAVTIRGNAGSGIDGSLHLPANSTMNAGGVTTIAGNFIASSSATFTPSGSGLVFNATTTGKTLITPFALGSTTFSGSGGGWTFATTSTTSDLTIKTGATVVAPATTLSIAGNYTNSGTFTNNAGTVNFAGSSWDVSEAVYTGKYKSVSAQDGSPQDIAFSADGTKMYMVGNDNNNLYQYTLSTAWDVTTAVYSTSIASADLTPVGITFSPNGTKMFETGWTNGAVYPYTLSTPWDLSTAVVGTAQSFSGGIHDSIFSPDGTKMYVGSYTNGTVSQYALSTAWDVGTAVSTGLAKSISETGSLTGLFLSSDGTKMYVMGFETSETIYQYALSTPGDVSTAQYTSLSKYVGGEDDLPLGLTLSPDGTKMYMVDVSSPYNVYQYDLSAQTATGTMTGTSAFNNVVVTATSTAQFLSNASTSNFTINSGATAVAPASLTVAGDLVNNGTYDTGVGKRWTAGTSTEANQWTSITYGNGLFVAVANTGTNRIMTSPDSVTWTAYASPVVDEWLSITYGNGIFVASGYNGNIIRSTDGVSWTNPATISTNGNTHVSFVNGGFIAVAQNNAGSPSIYSSSDGITWTPRYTHATEDTYLRSITYGNGVYIVAGYNNDVASSTDGINWTFGTMPPGSYYTYPDWSVAFGNGTFVIKCSNCDTYGDSIATSPDGRNWTFDTLNADSPVVFQNGLFMMNSTVNSGEILVSRDGFSWERRSIPIDSVNVITYGDGKYVGVAYDILPQQTLVSQSLLTMSSTSAQTLSGTLTGTSSLGNVIMIGTSSPISNGLVGYWSLNTSATNWVTGSTGSTTDGSGNGRTGDMTNMSSATSPITGKREQALTFDGANDYVATAETTFVTDFNSDHSQFAWVYPTAYAAGAYQSIVSFGEADDSDWETGMALYDTNGYLVQMTDGWDPEYVDSTLTVPLNQWSFVGVVRTSGQVTFYVNGNSTVIGTGGSGTIGTDPILIGASGHNGSLGGYFDGGIDEVALYNRALSDNEVASLYSFNAKTFANNASTTNMTINTGATVVAPAQLSIAGNYTNSGTFTAGTGTTTFNGTDFQTATGTMSGASAFKNVEILNNSATTTFNAPFTSTGQFTAIQPNTKLAFPRNATTTLTTATIQGTSGNEIRLRAATTTGTARWGLAISGGYTITYVDVKDGNGSSTAGNITATSSIDSTNNNRWTFAVTGGLSLSSASNQTFGYTQATSTISTITITDTNGGTVTAANDIRIRIASTSVNMKWDTTDTTVTVGGTASGKVGTTVTYENSSTTLVIPVSNDFSAGDTLTIDGLSFSQFLGVNAATVGLNMFLAGASDSVSDDADDKTIAISGLSTLIDHTSGQVADNINSTTEVGIPLFAFNMNSVGEDATVSSLIIRLRDVNGVTTGDLSNFALYRDNNSNRTYEAGDTAVGGTPVVSISGETGTITFSTSFSATSTAKNYLLIGSVDNMRVTEGFTLSLSATDITMAGVTTGLMTQTASLTMVRHMKGGGGGSVAGGHGAIGGAPPAGDGIRGGGSSGGGSGSIDPNSGTPIGNEDGFNAPSGQGSPQGAWTNGANVYTSDGVYTTTSGNGARHTFTTFNFNVPLTNTVDGVEVKVEASGSTAAGTISVGLSWNNGSTLTSLKTTSTLGLTDSVFLLGGPADTWGRSWTPSEMANGSFAIEITGNTSSNTISVDAIQTKVYHHSSGGGGGGGGAI